MATGLRLRAVDSDDLAVLSACVQDALVPLDDMAYLAAEQRFVMVVNRFVWERGEPREGAAFERTHGLLSFQGVDAVRVRGIDQRERGRFLNLLGLHAGEGCIDILFSDEGTIRLAAPSIDAVLADLGESWPTRWRPAHD